MRTTPPSTGAPSDDHRFIFMPEATRAATSAKPRPSGSAASGTHPVREPSPATRERAMPSPSFKPLAAGSGGDRRGRDLGVDGPRPARRGAQAFGRRRARRPHSHLDVDPDLIVVGRPGQDGGFG